MAFWTKGSNPDDDDNNNDDDDDDNGDNDGDDDWEPPQPDQDQVFKYGNKCGKKLDRSRCEDGCDCFHSYPIDDPLKWKSLEKACRCLPKQRAAEGYTYADTQCARAKHGTCDGSCDCRRSYPNDDPMKWKSNEVMCRCKPEA